MSALCTPNSDVVTGLSAGQRNVVCLNGFPCLEIEAFRMGDVINASFTPAPKDGGKARILRRRRAIMVEHMFHGSALPDDLIMDKADPEDTRPSELA